MPKKPTIEHYQRLFGVESQKVREEKGAINLNFALNFRNSVIVAVACTFVSLFLNSLAAFAFAKFNFPGKEKIFTLLISTLMIPGQVTMIPIFFVIKDAWIIEHLLGVDSPWIGKCVWNIFDPAIYVDNS